MSDTVFEIAESNGGAGFWIAKPSWGNTVAHVVYVGPARGYGVDPEANVVLVDVYSYDAGDLKDELSINKTAHQEIWIEAETPDWVTYKQPRDLNDPAIIESLSARRDGNGNLAPKKPGKSKIRTLRVLTKGTKNLTMERSDQGGNDWEDHVFQMTAALKDIEPGRWYDIECEVDRKGSMIQHRGTSIYRYFSDAELIGPSDFDDTCARAEAVMNSLETAVEKYGDLDAKQKKNLNRYSSVPEYEGRIAAIKAAMPEKKTAKRAKKVPVEELTEGVFTIDYASRKVSSASLGKGRSAKRASVILGDHIRTITSGKPAVLNARYAGTDDQGDPQFAITGFLRYDMTDLAAAKLADKVEDMVSRGKMLSDSELATSFEMMRGQDAHAERMEALKTAAEYTEIVAKLRFMEEATQFAGDQDELQDLIPNESDFIAMDDKFSCLQDRIQASTLVKADADDFSERRELIEGVTKYWTMPKMKHGFSVLLPDSEEVTPEEPVELGNDMIIPAFEGRSFEIKAYHVAQYGWYLKDHIGETGRLVYGRPALPEALAA